MTQTFMTASGHTFSSLKLNLLEIYTDDEVYNMHHCQVVTAANGDKYSIFDSKHIQGRIYRLLLLPVEVSQ